MSLLYFPKMSTTSSATASGRDQVPFDESNLKNQMCLFILTKKRLGHTHPMGVLCYSVMELVVLFCSMGNMQCATCRAIKATVLYNEAIAVRTSAPSEAQVRAYMIAVDGKPSETQPLPLEGQGEVPLVTPNQVEKFCNASKQTLGT